MGRPPDFGSDAAETCMCERPCGAEWKSEGVDGSGLMAGSLEKVLVLEEPWVVFASALGRNRLVHGLDVFN